MSSLPSASIGTLMRCLLLSSLLQSLVILELCKCDDPFHSSELRAPFTGIISAKGGITYGYNPNRQIRKDVFDTYVSAIPVSTNQPMQVRMNLQLVMLVDVNEPEEAILLNCWIMVFWDDDALKWDPVKYNSSVAEFPTITKLWVPDITWYERIPMVEAYEGEAGVFSGARAVVKYDGEVYVSRGLLMKSYCALSVKKFPFDRQECNFTFSSNLHNNERLVLQAIENRKQSLTDTEGWSMLGFPVTTYNKTIRGVGVFSRVVFTLQMKRKPMFYVFYLMLPSFLISALSCLVFVLPPQSTEKVPFCVSILLSLTVFMMIMTGLTPPTEDVPLLSIYFLLVLLLAMLNAAATIVLENVYESDGIISCLVTRLCVGTYKCCESQSSQSALNNRDRKRRPNNPNPNSLNRNQKSSAVEIVAARGTTSSAQAANLAHYFEIEEFSEKEHKYLPWKSDRCGNSQPHTLAQHNHSHNNNQNNSHNHSQQDVDDNSEFLDSEDVPLDWPNRLERIKTVERLNRYCFFVSLSIALFTPALFTLYGVSDH